MRTPRVRFTVRGLMIAVAIAGILFAAQMLMHRRMVCLRLCDEHFASVTRVDCLDEPEPAAEWTDYHRRLGWKYYRASSRPWLPFAPNPPEPK